MKLLTIACLLVACQEPGGKTTPLEPRHAAAVSALGFTDARRTGDALFECSDSDSVLASATFIAKNAQGVTVTGAVCCGLMFKGCTVRF